MSSDDPVGSELRACKRCGNAKPVTEFYGQQTIAYCKPCWKSYMNDRRDAELARDPVGLRLRELKANAKRRGLECSLSSDEMGALLNAANCESCGIALDGDAPETARELDRVNNGKGYVTGNVYALCFLCNRKKGDMSIADLEGLLIYMKKRLV